MRLNDISPAVGSKPSAKRLGRGIGSGLGKTSARGHKGQRVVSTRPQRPPLVGQFCYPKPKLGSWLVARPLIANRVQLLIRQNVRDHKRRSKIRLRPQLGNNLSIPEKIN